ncbi:MAG: hypothetical protein IPN69_03105 [Acidobacteria bacterium]|nr:hypothetical protein [Acidobacteriota bacterium]
MLIAGIILILVAIALVVWLVFYSFNPSSKELSEQVKNIGDRYDPNIKQAAARRQSNKAITRAALASELKQEVSAVHELDTTKTKAVFLSDHTLPRLEREEELSLTQHQHAIDSLNLQRNLISYAQASGMDVTTYLEVLKTRALNEAEIQKIEAQAQANLNGGFILQLQAYQRLAMLRDNLDALYEREHQIQIGNDPETVKIKKLGQVTEDIKVLEEDIGGRRQRLLQAFDEKDSEGSDEDSDLR